MKYKLLKVGTGSGCQQNYVLVECAEGYDLIQFKRGRQTDSCGLVLKEGEPAFMLDTGKFYIGGLNGVPICINPGSSNNNNSNNCNDCSCYDSDYDCGHHHRPPHHHHPHHPDHRPGQNPDTDPSSRGVFSLACRHKNFKPGDLIVVAYGDMITADGKMPQSTDTGKYLSILVVTDNNLPIGVGFLTNWNYTVTSAQFKYNSFSGDGDGDGCDCPELEYATGDDVKDMYNN